MTKRRVGGDEKERRLWKEPKLRRKKKKQAGTAGTRPENGEPENSLHTNSAGSEAEDDTELPASVALRDTFGSSSIDNSAHYSAPSHLTPKEEIVPRKPSTQASAADNAEHLRIADDVSLEDVISEASEKEDESDADEEQPKAVGFENDPFGKHLEHVIPDSVAERAQQRKDFTENEYTFPCVGKCSIRRLGPNKPELYLCNLRNSFVRKNLLNNISSGDCWSEVSDEYFGIINSYVDLFHFHIHHDTDLDIKRAYCLHVLNHALKTRNKIISHNSKIAEKKDRSTEYRDQSYHRPKTLILLPFRHNAYRIYQIFCQLLNAKEKTQIMNRKRFEEEFGWTNSDPVANDPDRPADFKANFSGNTDDCFRIGIACSKKSLKLYTEFYAADIIIASPLGLRMIIGNEGDKKYEYDFLSSIELLILDQADVFLMQNWDHLSHILKHIHRLPVSTKDVDFSRIRPWLLNGWGKIYRQTLLFSSIRLPEMQAVMNRHCFNYEGSVTVTYSDVDRSLSRVMSSIPHEFHRIQSQDPQKMADIRLRYFLDKILQPLLDTNNGHTMIFVPSYFDFVCIRNHFKREELSFVQICEYSSSAKVARARDLFFHGKKRFLLYTERFHFYRRYRIRGIQRIIFFELPHYPQYYSEVCNMMTASDNAATGEKAIALFSKLDFLKLVPVVGAPKAKEMVQGNKSQYTFVTGGTDS
ncbi:U3 small nucleolar RNA-associated protein 25 homolog [Paramacrobiotus metropolitanus]|uniref:U3 small nucleolar RNA-associated protein 25 homolog n=1 Tax=Paramacrobiotus metropolitanus TaxID=2943436 RepID=UPI00244568B0|nr:U3 small nucleolar RNA-associated protein 25 homolog [Paramacrobiotus metropolitanus]